MPNTHIFICVIFLDDLIVRSHPEIPWTKIGVKELLNWPHVTVEFKSPELSFKRKNSGEYFRFVNLNNSYIPVPKNLEYIEQIDIVEPSTLRHCYSLGFLRAYANEYVSLLKSIKGVSFLISQFIIITPTIESKNCKKISYRNGPSYYIFLKQV